MATAVALLMTGIVTQTGAPPALAADGASVVIDKEVNSATEVRDVRPGDTLRYLIDFAANDDDADGPVSITDAIPVQFAGWEISGLTARFGGSTTGLTLDLPGVTSGAVPGAPVSGVLSEDPDELTISLSVALPVFPGVGNTSGLGMPTGNAGVLVYEIVVPATLPHDSPILQTDIVNTATIAAFAGTRAISARSSATVEIENPTFPQPVATKQWTPADQPYAPGLSSSVVVGATLESDAAVSSVTLQDPADPALTPDGAATLPDGNPFRRVDFAGFSAPTNPASPPPGADAVDVSVYAFDGTSWSWTSWSEDIDDEDVAGIRITYTSDEAAFTNGATFAQGFDVTQRSTDRATTDSLAGGWTQTNTVIATATASGVTPVSSTAEATVEAIPTRIEVAAEKRFYLLPTGQETANLTGVSAGDSVGVVARAINRPAPRSTTLDTLVLREPASGADDEYFGENLRFGGFDLSSPGEVWPEGATDATLTWFVDDDGEPVPQEVVLAAGAPLPAPPAGAVVRGFQIEFRGEIGENTRSQIRYTVQTNDSEDFVPHARSFLNRVSVVGSAADLPEIEPVTGDATLTLIPPSVTVDIDKTIGPRTVIPGQRTYVRLAGQVQSSGPGVKTTELTIEDSLDGAKSALGTGSPLFWDAFDATQVLPPISRPLSGDSTQADLDIYVELDGDWELHAHNPVTSQPLDLPTGITGIRFVYSHAQGFSQTTYVTPNLSFTARATLRAPWTGPTSDSFDDLRTYRNHTTVAGEATVGDRVLTPAPASDTATAGIRADPGQNSPQPGDIAWAGKSWAANELVSQSRVETQSTQRWAVIDAGFGRAELTDPAAPTSSGQGTVFEAFDLTRIRPVVISGSPGQGTVDEQMRWDRVAAVELYDGTSWVEVAAPDGTWTHADGTGFKGLVLDEAQQASTVGVRLVVTENSDARQAALDDRPDDPTIPAVGSGVAASADIRSVRFDWRLRDVARRDGTELKWVTHSSAFNCTDDEQGCIENVFETAALLGPGGTSGRAVAEADIKLVDAATNVTMRKQLQRINPSTGLPQGSLQPSLSIVVPNHDEVAPEDYASARIILTARNSSETPSGSLGAMQLAKIRITDATDPDADAIEMTQDPFASRDFQDEAASGSNPFDYFGVTAIRFGTIAEYIDTQQSTVTLWHYDPDTAGTGTTTVSLQDVMDQVPAVTALLPDVIGVSTVFTGTDPETNGNSIPVGGEMSMLLDVQLRATQRSTGEAAAGNGALDGYSVVNHAEATGWDAVVSPDALPRDLDHATFLLEQADIDVLASKAISVTHGSSRNQTIYETEPEAPVRVALSAQSSGSTAPISELRLEDDTPDFWDRFQLSQVLTPTRPLDSDVADVEVKVAGEWIAVDGFTGDLAEVRGVAVTFTRSTGSGLFPAGAASWNTSWGAASLPLIVTLRSDADVQWDAGSQTNTVHVTATSPSLGTVTNEAAARVLFSLGTHAIRVEKHAPAESSTHQADALVSLPWELTFTNIGTSYLPITHVTDNLPSSLTWDGEPPTVTSTPGPAGVSGLTDDPTSITTSLSDDEDSLQLVWPEGQRMYPGETVTIRLGLIMSPLPADLSAINSVVVETDVTLVTCEQPTSNGQMPEATTSPTECSNRNYVLPREGAAVATIKAVKSTSDGLPGDDLVDGAVNIRTGEQCTAPSLPLVPQGYTRFPCAAYTTIGGTDSWFIQNVNVGSADLGEIVMVDMLPRAGDRLLSGGASRESTYRPVLVGTDVEDAFTVSGLDPEHVHVSVTTDPEACIGPDDQPSLWTDDPTCEDVVSNPANVWVDADNYTGALSDIAGVRFRFDLTDTPLAAAETIAVEFDTVNVVDETVDGALEASLATFEQDQYIWNQNGVIAWDTNDVRVRLPIAPTRAGVLIATGDLEISKHLLGEGVADAPDAFEVELACTVPSGGAVDARATLDLGDLALIRLGADEPVRVSGLPLGTDCDARERGAIGEFGETGRSIQESTGVTPSEDGMSAAVQVRDIDRAQTELAFSNTYTVGGVTVQKATRSTNSLPVHADVLASSFGFELTCVTPGRGDTIVTAFSVTSGAQHVVDDVPVGAVCSLQEIDARGAESTAISVGGTVTPGATVDGIEVMEGGVMALVTNDFVGRNDPDPTDGGSDGPTGGGTLDPAEGGPLATSGVGITTVVAAVIGLLLLGLGLLASRARRRHESTGG